MDRADRQGCRSGATQGCGGRSQAGKISIGPVPLAQRWDLDRATPMTTNRRRWTSTWRDRDRQLAFALFQAMIAGRELCRELSSSALFFQLYRSGFAILEQKLCRTRSPTLWQSNGFPDITGHEPFFANVMIKTRQDGFQRLIGDLLVGSLRVPPIADQPGGSGPIVKVAHAEIQAANRSPSR
ncbi:hypothetical protein [Sphingomonas paucimobilis]|uniref:hypothetical protein n=1 Tax=Sphingomonas paucimobilis TaxID=13689 RepID=UPI0028D1A7F4|nr:hypothetical protein [Sphingomonas paucimobilis]